MLQLDNNDAMSVFPMGHLSVFFFLSSRYGLIDCRVIMAETIILFFYLFTIDVQLCKSTLVQTTITQKPVHFLKSGQCVCMVLEKKVLWL